MSLGLDAAPRHFARNVDDEVAVESEGEEEMMTPMSSDLEDVPCASPRTLLEWALDLQPDSQLGGAFQQPIRKTSSMRKKRELTRAGRARSSADPVSDLGRDALRESSGGGASSSSSSKEPRAYRVDRGVLKLRTRGLAFRKTPRLEDKVCDDPAPWGSVVHGVPAGDDWLNVDGRFLPFRLQGCFVLVPLQGKAARQSEDVRRRREGVASGDDELLRTQPAGSEAIHVALRRPCGKVVVPAFRLCPGDRLVALRHAAEVAIGCGVGLSCKLAYGNKLLKDRHTVEEADLCDGAEILCVVEKDRNASIVDDIIPLDSDSDSELATPDASDDGES